MYYDPSDWPEEPEPVPLHKPRLWWGFSALSFAGLMAALLMASLALFCC